MRFRPVGTVGPDCLPPLIDLTSGVPERIVDLIVVLLRHGSRQTRHVVGLPPVSIEWLQDSAASSAKRGDPI